MYDIRGSEDVRTVSPPLLPPLACLNLSISIPGEEKEGVEGIRGMVERRCGWNRRRGGKKRRREGVEGR